MKVHNRNKTKALRDRRCESKLLDDKVICVFVYTLAIGCDIYPVHEPWIQSRDNPWII